MKKYQIADWCHHFIREHVKEGDLCIDATAGNGYDTQLLCHLVGDTGQVLAFDIQDTALASTKGRLEKAGLSRRASLILDTHCHMNQYASADTVSCIVFNLGYLPSGDHTVATKPETTISALKTGLALLKKDGLISLCIYSGGDSGFEERDAVLDFLKSLDQKKYLVILSQYFNRSNHPPIPVLLYKL